MREKDLHPWPIFFISGMPACTRPIVKLFLCSSLAIHGGSRNDRKWRTCKRHSVSPLSLTTPYDPPQYFDLILYTLSSKHKLSSTQYTHKHTLSQCKNHVFACTLLNWLLYCTNSKLNEVNMEEKCIAFCYFLRSMKILSLTLLLVALPATIASAADLSKRSLNGDLSKVAIEWKKGRA